MSNLNLQKLCEFDRGHGPLRDSRRWGKGIYFWGLNCAKMKGCGWNRGYRKVRVHNAKRHTALHGHLA